MKIIYEDDNLIVVDKPAGLVVHPGAGEHADTLTDSLVERYPEIKKLPWPDPERIGIVHRLDKDTSGLMILAKTPAALERLQTMIRDRQIKKSYLALVLGKLDKKEGEIVGFIGRDPNARRKQISKSIHFDFQPGSVRESKTLYKTLEEYRYKKHELSLLEATLETGRMHQIRVHFKTIGHPVIGDQTYNIKHSRILSKILGLDRQFLHSYHMEFTNPFDQKHQIFESDLPADLAAILDELDLVEK